MKHFLSISIHYQNNKKKHEMDGEGATKSKT